MAWGEGRRLGGTAGSSVIERAPRAQVRAGSFESEGRERPGGCPTWPFVGPEASPE